MKDWYLHVKEETMAPARMMQFAERHIGHCEVCRQDSGLAEEIEKIRDFVLPESKIPKAEREEEEATPEISPDEEEGVARDEDEDEDFANDFEEDDEV
ncbi:MAG: hypothetical protein RBR09_11150 [Desulfobulbaceae bacterium]|jgi:hypothetical protein|nr:hypothetical protein [Desulfobulbaceae bacterium]MDY0351800.1 hypothetical protein [Desulfobulbaceae bacterium]